MPKLYAESSKQVNDLKPKKETIEFILNYSKAYHVMKVNKKMSVEMLKN